MIQKSRVVLTAPAFIKGWLISTTLWVGSLLLLVAVMYGVPTLLTGTDAGHLWGVAAMVLLYGYGIAIVFAAPLAWVLAYLLRPVSRQWIHVGASSGSRRWTLWARAARLCCAVKELSSSLEVPGQQISPRPP